MEQEDEWFDEYEWLEAEAEGRLGRLLVLALFVVDDGGVSI